MMRLPGGEVMIHGPEIESNAPNVTKSNIEQVEGRIKTHEVITGGAMCPGNISGSDNSFGFYANSTNAPHCFVEYR